MVPWRGDKLKQTWSQKQCEGPQLGLVCSPLSLPLLSSKSFPLFLVPSSSLPQCSDPWWSTVTSASSVQWENKIIKQATLELWVTLQINLQDDRVYKDGKPSRQMVVMEDSVEVTAVLLYSVLPCYELYAQPGVLKAAQVSFWHCVSVLLFPEKHNFLL